MGDDPKNLKVRAYGASSTLPRAGLVDDDERYLTLLRRWWNELPAVADVLMVDRARSWQTMKSGRLLWHQDNGFFGVGGDVLIVHCGAADCTLHPLHLRERHLIERLPTWAGSRVYAWVRRNRARLLRRRNIRALGPTRFARYARDWLSEAAEVHDRVYVVNMLPTNPEIDAHSPKQAELAAQYNRLLAKAIALVGAANVHLIDVNGAINNSGEDVYEFVFRGDWHPTARTHRLVFEMIRDLEIEAGVGEALGLSLTSV